MCICAIACDRKQIKTMYVCIVLQYVMDDYFQPWNDADSRKHSASLVCVRDMPSQALGAIHQQHSACSRC